MNYFDIECSCEHGSSAIQKLYIQVVYENWKHVDGILCSWFPGV